MSSNSNNSQIERMKALMTYGLVNESAKNKRGVSGNIEYTAKGADGKSYAIVRECTKYFIKSAPAGANSMLAENYDYLGGYMNKKSHEYDSYNQAMKNFEMKLRSINEACGAKTDTEFTNPDRKPDLIKESTAEMSKELLRARQIISNVAAINEGKSCEMCCGSECEDEIKKTSEKPAKSGEPFVEPSKAEMEKPVGQTSKSAAQTSTPYDEKAQLKKMQQVAESCSIKEEDGDVEDADEETPGVEDVDVDKIDETPALADDPETSEDDDVDDDENEVPEASEDDDMDDDEVENPETSEDDDVEDNDVKEPEDESKEELLSRIEELEKRLAELEDKESDDNEEDEYELDTEDDADLDNDMDSDEDNLGDEDEDEYDLGDEDEDEDEFDSYDDLPDEVKDVTEPMIESIVRAYRKPVNEDRLNIFGAHPSYRKQPMTVPSNADMSKDTVDFDDESVKSTAPFGSAKGNGYPYGERYNKLVAAVTANVMNVLRDSTKK